jgi:Holliday junction resolvase
MSNTNSNGSFENMISRHSVTYALVPMSDSKEKGSELERRIAAFLRTHDYVVSTNVIREGRSGARHELDVVGEKHDGLTSFELIVECKAWESPIDKDVVYKLASELADLGAAKGVIATLSGWTVQAGQAAAQANIEMWGPEELESRMGQLSMNQLRKGPKQLIATGPFFNVNHETAFVPVSRMAKGTLGSERKK